MDSQAKPRSHDGNLSIIAIGTTVTGEVATGGVVKVEGVVDGNVRADRQVLIAKSALIEGDVYTREAVVGGRVLGSIYAEERVEVEPGATIEGDIVTKRLLVQEGGNVNGNIQMGDVKAISVSRAEPPLPPPADVRAIPLKKKAPARQ
jgi:cytoskeletal protein CcmA (bactofilin family)